MRSNKKNFLFQKPMQLLIHGQWWSMLRTHLLQLEQWWHLSGLKILHIRQYRRRFCSGSPRWNPQKTGTYPGSVVIACTKDQTSMMNTTWKNTIMTYVGTRSKQKVKLHLIKLHTWRRKAEYEGVDVIDGDNGADAEKNERVTNYHVGRHGDTLWHLVFPIF